MYYVADFEYVIFKLILLVNILRTPCEIAFVQMRKQTSNDQLALFKVMVWCRQATNQANIIVDPDSLGDATSLWHNGSRTQ